MPTSFYLVNTTGSTTSGFSTGDDIRSLETSRGAGLVASADTPTVAGPTSGLSVDSNNAGTTGRDMVWVSQSLNSFTFSTGLNTFNYWMSENNMAANVGAQALVYKWSSGTLTLLVNTERGVELAVTTRGAENWTAATASPTAFATSDRLVVRMLGNDVGTMGSGFTFNGSWALGSSGADGDSWISFVDTISTQGAVVVADSVQRTILGIGI